tara:strand:+ start:697 stop:1236 length:540 start_codon:yes stop_codon:yes gene_type:complete
MFYIFNLYTLIDLKELQYTENESDIKLTEDFLIKNMHRIRLLPRVKDVLKYHNPYAILTEFSSDNADTLSWQIINHLELQPYLLSPMYNLGEEIYDLIMSSFNLKQEYLYIFENKKIETKAFLICIASSFSQFKDYELQNVDFVCKDFEDYIHNQKIISDTWLRKYPMSKEELLMLENK